MGFNLLWYYLFLFFVPMYIYYCYKRISLIFLEKMGIGNYETYKITQDKNYYLRVFFETFLTLFLNPFTLLSELHKDRITITDYNNLYEHKKKNVFILFQAVYLIFLFLPWVRNLYILSAISFVYSFSFLGFFMVVLERTLRTIYFHLWSWFFLIGYAILNCFIS